VVLAITIVFTLDTARGADVPVGDNAAAALPREISIALLNPSRIAAAAIPIPVPRPSPARRQPPRDMLCEIIATAAREHELPVKFLTRLIWQESRFRVSAVSHAGAQGIAQFMPATAAERKLKDPFNPRQALWAAAGLLRSLKLRFGNLGLAAAAYNAGPKRVSDWLGKKRRLPEETRNYVKAITGRPASSWAGSQKGDLGFVHDKPEPGCGSTVVATAGSD
jgi:soluble lytic murein transglycosylase-like protein